MITLSNESVTKTTEFNIVDTNNLASNEDNKESYAFLQVAYSPGPLTHSIDDAAYLVTTNSYQILPFFEIARRLLSP